MKKIIISTGGSGGHVIPSLVIYDHLKDKFDVMRKWGVETKENIEGSSF